MPEIFGAGDERFEVVAPILSFGGRQLAAGQVIDVTSGNVDPKWLDNALAWGLIAPVRTG